MGYKATEVTTTFKFAKLVPKYDDDLVYFKEFREIFGEDANMMAIGLNDSTLYTVEKMNLYSDLIDSLNTVEGVNAALGLPNIQIPVKNKRKKRFDLEKVFAERIASQKQLNDYLSRAKENKFYGGQLWNQKNAATLIVLDLKQNYIDSTYRGVMIQEIQDHVATFEKNTKIKTYAAGIPLTRTVLSKEVKKEMSFFLYLSLAVTAAVLMFFFRSWIAVVFPLIVIGVAVVWTMGTLGILGYKISMLTGLIPPIIVVIGIPNCVYLLNKYHQEYDNHGNKIKALSAVIRKIGIVTLITNCTTAVGFVVLIFAKIDLLKEFGMVAGINVFATFIISIILIPAVYAYLPPPNSKQLKHLDFKGVQGILDWIEDLVLNKRKWVYAVTAFIVLVSGYGTYKIYAVSYMIDDLPPEHELKSDLAFFEKNFGGLMPLEIVINTHDKKAFTKVEFLDKVDQFQEFLSKYDEISEPISVLNLVKAAKQAYWGGYPEDYTVPTNNDRGQILKYMVKSKGDGNEEFLNKFVDSTGRFRISVKVADVGSRRLDTLIHHEIMPFADSLFQVKESEVEIHYTGTTLLFIKGNSYLINNLRQSLYIAVGLIAIIMGSLFGNVRMVILSLIPNIIPLLITGALMGYMGIPLKPSTALIFSIAFGISVDDSIHYLAKFRQELFANGFNVREAVKVSIHETGASMMYTSIILFFGFIIFAGSSFLGTVMLGVLTSTTLLFAMITNLVVLPSLLITFDKGKRKGNRQLIDDYNENQTKEEEA